jgi:hypothetical protein
MQYMMAIFEDTAESLSRDDPKKAEAYWGAWTAYSEELAKSGLMIGGNGLQLPHTATTLRLRGGKRQVQDGPFADSKEQLAGYFILEVPDLDTALDWASRCPAVAAGAVELRPVLPPPSGV